MGEIIKGKNIADKIKLDISEFVNFRKANNLIIPKIASILVGEDGGSIYYINNQEKISKSLGVGFDKILFPSSISEEELINEIIDLNNREDISGIILQLPLPKEMNEKRVISNISADKDIDCLTYENVGKLYMGEKCFLPCTPNSVIRILKSLDITLEGKRAVVIGRSNIVGKPLSTLLLNENCTVTVCHSKTKNLKDVCKEADILISAIGKPKFIDDEFVKDGAIVIDVGTSSVDGKITGDVDFDKVIDKASFVTPVPGGVGALTTTLLIKNSCEALEKDED
ncbi:MULTISPECIES: tetrahydrofolate dehydrogenase/cyclohydrolase catalytic domain-containing protein [Clostridium]|uniref:Bifunctional protein FolD n=1 Tax=Clostridium disporicum TaxID=84024 RepID=A0A174G836_9CLOT|nr:MULTISPECIES: tetrahydrofolate dehydrogenase/cyclohydrolase catalytic domain-containing protein [Clostridium]MCD2500201.1 bifunctional methylenetetrahydrofolate dehydrogenase/methenyltetrahydrofolate cyclohydrolase [Clostridium sp. NSJ-145]MDU6340398.1 tetrahydrofolate dehydrogenase/cyclohydrolase catalytic domain-containing protein [Clostridium sp.]CUO57837.1 bifunctional 5%2C10-methylene-tetrahydrofolate dehydrogenase/ 5%2C10-methylene-tetrahydrofolate cyclohydrolase [Clostridium disporicum